MTTSAPPPDDEQIRAEHIRRMVDEAPPLTAEQIDQLAPIWTAAARRAAQRRAAS